MMHRFAICCLSALALGVGACAATSSKVRVQKAESGVPECRTFAWLTASKDAASLTEQRVRTAVIAQLQAKGYALSADKPDCRITYLLSTQELPRARPSVGVGAGGGSRGGVRGGIGVNLPIGSRDGRVGTFTLDVVDVASNSQVWSGSLDATFDSSELNADEAQEVVRKVLAEYPDAEAEADGRRGAVADGARAGGGWSEGMQSAA